MANFRLQMTDSSGDCSHIYYDNMTNMLHAGDFVPLVYVEENEDTNPIPYTIRVFAGRDCNYRCKYCLQRGNRCNPEPSMSRRDLVKHILRVVDDRPIYAINLWGGEPFLYFEQMQEFVSLFRELAPHKEIRFTTSTNCSFLKDNSIRDWCIENIHRLQISWDGPGQHLRGVDPFVDAVCRDNLRAIHASEKCNLAFNPVMTKENPCLIAYADSVTELLGTDDYFMSAARLLIPMDIASAKHAITDEQDLQKYSRHLQRILLEDLVPQWGYGRHLASEIGLGLNKPVSLDYCTGKRVEFLIVDDDGHVLSCTNRYFDSVDDSGERISTRNIVDMVPGEGRPVAKWKLLHDRVASKCSQCLAYPGCSGGCPRVPKQLEEVYCRAKFAETIPSFVYLLFKMTGRVLSDIQVVE